MVLRFFAIERASGDVSVLGVYLKFIKNTHVEAGCDSCPGFYSRKLSVLKEKPYNYQYIWLSLAELVTYGNRRKEQ
jgi:hypothetical protein